MDGILNIRKEKGFTSHDVVAVVRRILHAKKVGHTGTLDPDAEGVLPVCVGKATKLADIIMDGKKRYRAMVRLGITTTTEDAAGEVLEERKVDFDEEKIRQAVAGFVGEQKQIPPMYSAIKVNGKKLYELAREGKEIERKARTITIFAINIVRFLPPDRFEIDVDCSKGTYIRTLCSDIGKALGCGAHMAELTVPVPAVLRWKMPSRWVNCRQWQMKDGRKKLSCLWKRHCPISRKSSFLLSPQRCCITAAEFTPSFMRQKKN